MKIKIGRAYKHKQGTVTSLRIVSDIKGDKVEYFFIQKRNDGLIACEKAVCFRENFILYCKPYKGGSYETI